MRFFVTRLCSFLMLVFVSLSMATIPITVEKLHVPTYASAQTEVNLQVQADNLVQQGLTHYKQTEFQEALNDWKAALELYQSIGNQAEQGHLYNKIGKVYHSIGNYEQAIASFQQAFSIALTVGDQMEEAHALNNWGVSNSILGNYGQSIELHQRALTIAQSTSNMKIEEGKTYNYLGRNYWWIGQYEQAIIIYQQALDIFLEFNAIREEGRVYTNLGAVYNNLGQYDKALEYHQQAIFIAQNTDDLTEEGRVYGNLGDVYYRLGQYSQALNYYQKSLLISQEINDLVRERQTSNNLGTVYSNLGQYEVAQSNYQRSLAISQEIGDRSGEGETYINLGRLANLLSKHEMAVDFCQKSLLIALEIGDQNLEGRVYDNLGVTYTSLKQYRRAIDFHTRAIEIAQKVGVRADEGIAYTNLGIVYRKLEQLPKAVDFLKRSIDIYETLRPTDLSNINQISLLDRQLVSYGLLQDTLIAQGQPEAALEFSERSRAQALKLQLLSTLPLQRVEQKENHLNIESIRKVVEKQAATVVNYTVLPNNEVLIWVIEPENGNIIARRSDKKIKVEDIALFPRLTDGRSRGTEILSLLQQESLQSDHNELIQNPESSFIPLADLNSALENLYEILIEPIADLLPNNEEDFLIFVPHKSLFNIPFAGLRNPETKEYLISNHTVSIVPSIFALDLTQELQNRFFRNRLDALIVGNPTLSDYMIAEHNFQPIKGAEKEAIDIARILDAHDNVLLNEAATEKAVISRLHSAKYIHFATHGALTQTPNYGAIPGFLVLAPSTEDVRGELTSQEIVELTQIEPLAAELVVLSACRTGQGLLTSDGVYGLSRAFLAGGTPSLIVSLWDASDNTTTLLMNEFYSNLIGYDGREPIKKAQALRRAMLTTMEEDRGQNIDPRYWAAFVLIGQPD